MNPLKGMLWPARRESLLAQIARFRPGPGGAHLTRLCRELQVGLRAERVRLTLDSGQQFGWPDVGVPADGPPPREVPLRNGMLYVYFRPWSFGRHRATLREVADLLGPVLENLPLQHELDRSLEEARVHAELVAAARRRAFGERDAERQEIERDLHDGAQHQLVALGMTLGLLELHAAKQNEPGVQAQIERLRSGLDRAQRTLLSSVEGGSPLLREFGVLPALEAELRDVGPQVRLEVGQWDGSRRYDATIELAVYFICLEGVNNARKHAPGAQVVVRLADGPYELTFSVADDGPGMEDAQMEGTSGLANMRRRITAAGGRLQIRTAPGTGTAIYGFIPL
ncbi:histidine kinase [Kineosporia rhizophila]|uniref:sensor histidine kinase n=1 Tax=Kineosporia rhizophila TaxID=84633 RepID=UPI000B08951F|nr:histidine kinase [Kineosporia rhizophila]